VATGRGDGKVRLLLNEALELLRDPKASTHDD
jgi:hypothetical protein